MTIIKIEIYGHSLLSLLDFFDTHKKLPPAIDTLNIDLRRQFARGIFSMKVDEYRNDNPGLVEGVKHAVVEIEEEEREAGTSTEEETPEPEKAEPVKKRARTTKERRARAFKRRRSISGESPSLRRAGTFPYIEGDYHEDGEEADRGETSEESS